MAVKTILLIVTVFFIGNSSMAQTLYLGLNADLRGGSAQSGEAIRLGIEMAIKDINKSGMLGKYSLALKTKDHRGNPARGIDNVLEYANDEDVIAIVGGLHTPVIMHELPIIHKKKIPYLVPWAAGTPIIKNGYTPNYVFRLSVRDEFAGEVLIRHAKDSGYKNVGLLLERTGWGRSNDKSMYKASNKLGLNITNVQWFNWGEKDFENHIKHLKDSGAQAIMLVANAPEGIEVIKAMSSLPKKQQLPVISHWGITGGNFVDKVGLDTLGKVDLRVLQTYLFDNTETNKIAHTLLQRYKAEKKQKHNYVNATPGFAHSYDLIHLLAKAIQKTSTPTRESIRDQLENIKEHSGLIKVYRKPFASEDHEALGPENYQMARFNKQGHIIPWRK